MLQGGIMLQIVLLIVTALTNPVNFPQHVNFGAGGPDAYGYRWIDNDTTAPNIPIFQWKDITSVGTLVTGLADDNVVGPFPIGFSFPYYWYRVNSFYIGSNGYIAFGDNYLSAHPFQNLPSPARPNNIVAALMSDLDFSVGSPACYYWTNPAQDTCIISYVNVRWWNVPTSCCSFQIILSRPDSSITFQYKKIQGVPYGGGWSVGNNTIGIENITGTIGLAYFYGAVPPINVPHDNLAVKFYPPDSSSYQVNDVGVWNVLNDNSGGVFFYNQEPRTIWAKIKNTGNQPVSNIPVHCRIRNAPGTIVYNSQVTIPSMTPGQLDSIAFTPNWTPSVTGVYRTVVRTAMAGDVYPANDSIIVETRVVTYPTELMYDDGTNDGGRYWNGPNGGFGNKFIPPRYPCRITAARVNLYYLTTPSVCSVFVYKDDGPGGTPGTVLARRTVTVNATSPTWYQINLDQTINSGGFFVGVIGTVNQEPIFSMDTSQPRSYQGWEYTGSWAPDRDAADNDVMMRALVDLGTGIEELGPTSINTRPYLSANPNPFQDHITIQVNEVYAPFKVVEIYNVLGEKVNKIFTTENSVIWNGTDRTGRKVMPGIYFAKLQNTQAPVLKIIKVN